MLPCRRTGTCPDALFNHQLQGGLSMTARFRILIPLLLSLPLLFGCTDNKKDKAVIEQGQDTAAEQAIQAVKVPMDRARTAADQEKSHIKQVEEQEKKQ